MPSENKTPNIGLNQWEGNEYPKREDFVDDNLIIDTKIKELQDATDNIEVPVTSVNNKTGAVVLKAKDIKLDDGKSVEQGIEDAHDLAQQAFQSASDGKKKIATAITGKGVPTSPSDTFTKMATNIDNIVTDSSIGTTDAVAADILAPKKVVSQGKLLTGTMPNRGNYVNDMTRYDSKITLSSGYYSGGTITSNITNLSAGNIAQGKTVGGITGTYTGEGNATAGQVLAGRTFSTAALSNTTGTMTNRGAVTNTITSQNGTYTIPAGYHSGSGKVTASFANLTSPNIKSGVNIGGVVGTAPRAASGSGISDNTGSMSATVGFKPSIIVVQLLAYDGDTVYGGIYNSAEEFSYANEDFYTSKKAKPGSGNTGELTRWNITSTGFTVGISNTNYYIIGNKPFMWAAFE